MLSLIFIFFCLKYVTGLESRQYVKNNMFIPRFKGQLLILAEFKTEKCYEADIHIETYCNINETNRLYKTELFEFINGVKNKLSDYNYHLYTGSRRTIHKHYSVYLGNYTEFREYDNYTINNFDRSLILKRGKGCPNENIDIYLKTFKLFERKCIVREIRQLNIIEKIFLVFLIFCSTLNIILFMSESIIS